MADKINLESSLEKFNINSDISKIISAIAIGAKEVQKMLVSPWERDLSLQTGDTNVQGEKTIALDLIADKIFINLLNETGLIRSIVSEEQEDVFETDNKQAEYVIAIDPLDGSSNVGVNIPVGTIFTIFAVKDDQVSANNFLRSGREIVCAGYVLYGVSTTLRCACDQSVLECTLDTTDREFYLSSDGFSAPEVGKIYSANEANFEKWGQKTRDFISLLKVGGAGLEKPCTARYVGSLVSDFDRNLQKGGVFLYPADSKNTNGKLRLLYECMPLAYIIEQAGGRAIDGKQDILEITPKDIHQRSPLIIGSKKMVEIFENMG